MPEAKRRLEFPARALTPPRELERQDSELAGLARLVAFLQEYRGRRAEASKNELEHAAVEAFDLTKRGAACVGDLFTLRFSSAAGTAFSNTVCGIRRLAPLDDRPFVVVVVRPKKIELLLANSTFLKRVSHSSRDLRADNLRGSFNGTDILRDYAGIPNSPEHFRDLLDIHREFTWKANLDRLVEATNGIAPRGERFVPEVDEVLAILRSPELALELISDEAYLEAKNALSQAVVDNSSEILDLAEIDNVNLRGNQIEQLITGGVNRHGLGDCISHTSQADVHFEIKTKVLSRSSSPKGFNVDKALSVLSTGTAAISYCFVGLELGRVSTSTVSILDRRVLGATRIQHHWAGRNSRGATQLTGDLVPLFAPDYREDVDIQPAREFLERLIAL